MNLAQRFKSHSGIWCVSIGGTLSAPMEQHYFESELQARQFYACLDHDFLELRPLHGKMKRLMVSGKDEPIDRAWLSRVRGGAE